MGAVPFFSSLAFPCWLLEFTDSWPLVLGLSSALLAFLGSTGASDMDSLSYPNLSNILCFLSWGLAKMSASTAITRKHSYKVPLNHLSFYSHISLYVDYAVNLLPTSSGMYVSRIIRQNMVGRERGKFPSVRSEI